AEPYKPNVGIGSVKEEQERKLGRRSSADGGPSRRARKVPPAGNRLPRTQLERKIRFPGGENESGREQQNSEGQPWARSQYGGKGRKDQRHAARYNDLIPIPGCIQRQTAQCEGETTGKQQPGLRGKNR